MKILLANLPWEQEGRKGVRAGSRWPHLKNNEEGDYLPYPFFLGYATSLLKKYGFEAKLIDAIAEDISEAQFLERIREFRPDLIFTETSAPSLKYDMCLLEKIKKDINTYIAVAAPSIEIRDEFLISYPFIDFAIFGEYEFTLLELAEALKTKTTDFKKIKGLIYRTTESIIRTDRRPLCRLDELPWPERRDVPIYKYLDSPGEMPLPCAQMLASRGCPFNCIFCAWPQIAYSGRNYRIRSVQDVVNEMEFLVKKMGFKSIYFDDDTFNIGKERMLELCREIERRKLNVPWAIMARPDLMDEEILIAMKKAGLWAIKYGIESGSQKIVDNSKKNLNLKIAKKNILFTKKLGIRVHLTFTFGLPGESYDTISQTEKFLYEIDPFSAQFSIATPFPGTEFYEQLKQQQKLITENLSEYNGSIKSVISTDYLSAQELEMAVKNIETKWHEHCNRRNRTLKTIFRLIKDNGLIYTLNRIHSLINKKTNVSKVSDKYSNTTGDTSKYFYDPAKDSNIIPIDFDFKKRFDGVDVLLIMPPPWGIFPPLSLAYLSAYLRAKGYKAGILDMNLELFQNASPEDKKWWHVDAYPYWVNKKLFPQLIKRFEKEVDKYVEAIISTEISLIGFTTHFANRPFAIEVARKIKQKNPNKIIIFGGPGTFTRHDREEYVPKGICDIFVVGEGEETLYEIVRAFRNGESLKNIPGTVVFDGKTYSELIPRPYIKNLDEIPFPTFEEFNLSRYPLDKEALPLLFSRGCISRCKFCNDWSLVGPFRMRSGDNMFQEVKYHVEHNKVNQFYFDDLLLNGNTKSLERFCDLVIASGIKINWSGSAIALKSMTYELLLKMRKAGCNALTYGIESGSNNVLKKMGKLFTVEEAERVIRDTYRAGIGVVINIIVGFPGETEEDYQETINFIKRNAPYLHMIGSLNTLCINLNSELDINQEKYGLLFKGDEDQRAATWYTKNGDNYETRMRRGKELLEILKELNLVVYTTNIPRDVVIHQHELKREVKI
ncbi:MAG: radical SAM protein [Nitrososphaeria archaeon]